MNIALHWTNLAQCLHVIWSYACVAGVGTWKSCSCMWWLSHLRFPVMMQLYILGFPLLAKLCSLVLSFQLWHRWLHSCWTSVLLFTCWVALACAGTWRQLCGHAHCAVCWLSPSRHQWVPSNASVMKQLLLGSERLTLVCCLCGCSGWTGDV